MSWNNNTIRPCYCNDKTMCLVDSKRGHCIRCPASCIRSAWLLLFEWSGELEGGREVRFGLDSCLSCLKARIFLCSCWLVWLLVAFVAVVATVSKHSQNVKTQAKIRRIDLKTSDERRHRSVDSFRGAPC